jgi:hypothetical protein
MRRPLRLVALSLVVVVGVGVLAWRSSAASRIVPDTLPAELSDAAFWQFTEKMSEANGYFRSDNFLSNEPAYQTVIPELSRTTRPGGVYLGVGPEQNFPYILAVRPKMAVIFDIRRGNLHVHLLYKALFEMSADRAEFLSRLWSRARPRWLNATSTVDELMSAYRTIPPTPEAYAGNLRDVTEWLTRKHGFALTAEDLDGIDFAYKTAFYEGGPDLTYSMRAGGVGFGFGGGRRTLTYADIQMRDDGNGVNRGFLANEENWRAIKDLQSRNLIVPVVGDFGGSGAIRSVGAYLRDHGAVVSAFYLSNVEQYLNQDGKEDAFLCNVAALPLDETSTFIYTGGGRYGRRGGGGRGFGGGGLNTTFLRPMKADTTQCRNALARLWR